MRERRWRYAQVAEQMMQHLAQHGSKINTLSFAPRLDTTYHKEVEEDGNSWPYYSYKHASVVVKHSGTQGVQVVKTTVSPQGPL